MATEWKNLPDTSTPITAQNLIKDQTAVQLTEPTGGQNVWIKDGKNLFNYKKALINTSISSSSGTEGNFNPNNSFDCSNFIKVKPNTAYIRSTTGAQAIFFYDSSKTYLSRTQGYSVTTPANCYYVVFNIPHTFEGGAKAVMFNQGTTLATLDDYNDYSINTLKDDGLYKEIYNKNNMGEMTVDDVRCRNIFDINGNVNIQANDGSQVSRNVVNGNVLTINSNSSSHYPVGQKFTNLNGKTITFSATVVSAGSSSAALPRIRASIVDNGTVVAYTQGTEGGVGDRVSITASCTSDNVVCGFVTMNGTGGQVTDIQVEINDEVTDYTPHKSFDATAYVLWTNSSPTSEFAEQAVTLSDAIENYKFYEVIYKFNTSSSSLTILSSGKIPVGYVTILYANNNLLCRRFLGTISGTSFGFQNCGSFSSYGGSVTQTNNYAIPYQILGYK